MLRVAVEGLPASVDVPKIKRHAGLNELAATGADTGRPRPAADEPVGVKESEEGSKEERVGLAATPSTGWPHPR
jgi:hypothetical protein